MKGFLNSQKELSVSREAFGAAMFHSLEGRKAEALKKAISLDPKLTGTAMVEPAFESIRGERRFQSLIRPGGQAGK